MKNNISNGDVENKVNACSFAFFEHLKSIFHHIFRKREDNIQTLRENSNNNMPISEKDILAQATSSINGLRNKVIDLIEIRRPTSVQYALQLTKIVSKLSPLLGNLFEFSIVDELNKSTYGVEGTWIRQDPGFPDARFISKEFENKNIGVEIKAWFPFATEITGRFKDSESIFTDDTINVAIVAWLPEYVFWGKPVVINTLIVSGKSIAEARDVHYHKPPHYLVFEPEDTEARTGNLQQTNTNGYVFQDESTKNKDLFVKAQQEVQTWGEDGLVYSYLDSYQQRLKSLLGKYPYRLDTNYAKIDRIEHVNIEAFKTNVLNTNYNGKSIKEWAKLASYDIDDERLEKALTELLK